MQQLVYVNAGVHSDGRESGGRSEMDLKSVNRILAQGWTVKQIVTPGEGRYRAFVLLERDAAPEAETNA